MNVGQIADLKVGLYTRRVELAETADLKLGSTPAA
jgi:hypothetical protein